MRDIKPGDYFLLPFAGKRRNLLVKAVSNAYHGHWDVEYVATGTKGMMLLSSCRRCSPSLAKRIMKVTP